MSVAVGGAAPSAVASAITDAWPSPRVAWYAVFVLSLALLINFLDRGILTLLVPAIKADLGMSDTQVGMVMGFAFVTFYLFLGLPIARYIDHGNRRNIMAFGLFLWAGMTALCGLARSFTSLFAFRIGVGVGEACTGPATFSILADLFPPAKLPRAIAVLNFGYTTGNGLALIIGGLVIDLLAKTSAIHFPVLGDLRVWQAAFLVVGMPGLLVTLLMMTVPEPTRRNAAPVLPSVRDVTRYLVIRGNVYGPLIGGIALGTILAFGSAGWTPTFFMRTYGMSPGEVGLAQGLIWLVLGPIGAMIGSAWAERLQAQGKDDANLRVTVYGLSLAMPFSILFPLVGNAEVSLVLYALSIFFTTFVLGPENAAIQLVTPNRMRGQITAVMLFTFNIIGVGLGPVIIALFTDYWFQSEAQIGSALAASAALLGPTAILVLALGLKPYGRAIAAQHATGGIAL